MLMEQEGMQTGGKGYRQVKVKEEDENAACEQAAAARFSAAGVPLPDNPVPVKPVPVIKAPAAGGSSTDSETCSGQCPTRSCANNFAP
jgi:hypothetical protein